ncbi:helix-turn-helix domain-containing protein [Phenylobacterium aquaticum]|uniref:helix-turn-helix domain-containing protein n=1 Tax=Phenylobacterium aquaticum TaxID=1763816 RepID=UPI0026E926CF|nr:helix-turn-helix domain-containing protein [Phenylobacterium aquaticum]
MTAIEIAHDRPSRRPAASPAGVKPAADTRDRNELQTLKRGLQALAFLNAAGPTTLAKLARHLDVPRPNAYRILQTLITEGYCDRVPNSRLYMVSPCVRKLSSGLGEGEVLTNVAMDVVEALGKAVKWPVALATPFGGEMLVRLTTDASTPLALAKISPGHRTPMLLTTTGVLYMAFTPPAHQKETIEASLGGRDIKQFFHSREQLQALIEESREQGYMILDSRFAEGCIGVPLMRHGRPLGGLVMRYIKSAMPRTKVIADYLPRLREAAAEIMARYGACEAAPCPVRSACMNPAVGMDDGEDLRPDA